MISRLYPLGVELYFDDASYELGDSINIIVDVSARTDVEVREARVDLVCEERFTEVYSVMVPASRPMPPTRGMAAPLPTIKVPKRVAEEFKESYVHSSVEFAADTRLQSGTTTRYDVKLPIDQRPPTYADKSTMLWKLVVSIDTVRARDVNARWKVDIKLPKNIRSTASRPDMRRARHDI